MWADTAEELHDMARKIGHRPNWFQPFPQHPIAHYDVVPSRRLLAIKYGAIARQFVKADFDRAREQGATPMPAPWPKETKEVHLAIFWGATPCGLQAVTRTVNPSNVTCSHCRNSYWFTISQQNPHNSKDVYEGKEILLRDYIPWLPVKMGMTRLTE